MPHYKVDMHPDPDANFLCANCRKKWKGNQLNPIEDLLENLSVGAEVPGGQCPECGAFAHAVISVQRMPVILHEEAQDLYDSSVSSEHHRYTREEWKLEVAKAATQLGYWEWLSHMLETTHDDGEGSDMEFEHDWDPTTGLCRKCEKDMKDDVGKNTPCYGDLPPP